MKNTKKITSVTALLLVLICALITTCACFFKHIEDTNGEEDISLCSITEERLCQSGTSYVVMAYVSSHINNTYNFSAEKMSGVRELISFNASSNNSYAFNITSSVTRGNLRLYFLNKGKIAEDVEIGGTDRVVISGISGKCELRAAAESAAFSVEVITD